MTTITARRAWRARHGLGLPHRLRNCTCNACRMHRAPGPIARGPIARGELVTWDALARLARDKASEEHRFATEVAGC
jgi:hypothetical protein